VAVQQSQQQNYLWENIKIIKQKLTATRLITFGGGGGETAKKNRLGYGSLYATRALYYK
jgi:hypothetical protein